MVALAWRRRSETTQERPDPVVFNRYANQYDARPLEATVSLRMRIWYFDAGPDRATSLHAVGGQFDSVSA
jgi:nitrite reductase (NO-forming)